MRNRAAIAGCLAALVCATCFPQFGLASGRIARDSRSDLYGDFNGSTNSSDFGSAVVGADQLLWRHSGGNLALSYFADNGSVVYNTNNATGNNLVAMTDALSATNLASTTKSDWTVDAVGDLDGDGQSEIIVRCATALGNGKTQVKVLFFADNGSAAISSTQPAEFAVPTGWVIEGAGRFNTNATYAADGRNQLLWRHTGGNLALSYFADNGSVVYNTNNITGQNLVLLTDPLSATNLASTTKSDWTIHAIGDVNGDSRDEVIMRCGTALGNGSTQIKVLFFADNNSGQIRATQPAAFAVPTGWVIQDMGRFNTNATYAPDSSEQLLWRHTGGNLALSYFADNGSVVYNTNNITGQNLVLMTDPLSSTNLASNTKSDWVVQAIGDLNNDGRDELVMRCTTALGNGKTQVKVLFFADNNSGQIRATQPTEFAVPTGWVIQGTSKKKM